MLSQPTSKRFLEAVQQTLRTGVAPAVQSRDATVMLQAIDAILAGLIRRTGFETTWMKDEISHIETAAEAVVSAGADENGVIAKALADVRTRRAGGELLEDVLADYARSSELLSKCLERALVVGGALRKEVETVLEKRLETENHIRGSFKVVGKD